MMYIDVVDYCKPVLQMSDDRFSGESTLLFALARMTSSLKSAAVLIAECSRRCLRVCEKSLVAL